MDEQRSPGRPVSVVIADSAAPPVGPPHLLERRPCADEARQEWVVGLTKPQAEDMLDWLEANGYPAGEVICREDGFAVRCPGFRAYRDKGGAIGLVIWATASPAGRPAGSAATPPRRSGG